MVHSKRYILTNGQKKMNRRRRRDEVFTPEWLVKQMCDRLVDEEVDGGMSVSDVWRGTILEPACGDGNFLVEIARRKLAAGLTPKQAASTMFGIDLMPDNIEKAISRVLEILPDTREILERNIVCGNFLTKKTEDGEPIWFL